MIFDRTMTLRHRKPDAEVPLRARSRSHLLHYQHTDDEDDDGIIPLRHRTVMTNRVDALLCDTPATFQSNGTRAPRRVT
jgi:hypothetical protein